MKKNEKYFLPWKCLQVHTTVTYTKYYALVKNENKFLENTCRFISLNWTLWTGASWTKLPLYNVQVNNYEIVVKIFHISHNLTWYSEIVQRFTRISKFCSTYELIKQFMEICVKNCAINLKKNNLYWWCNLSTCSYDS